MFSNFEGSGCPASPSFGSPIREKVGTRIIGSRSQVDAAQNIIPHWRPALGRALLENLRITYLRSLEVTVSTNPHG